MAKQFSTIYVSWRDAAKKPMGVFTHENSYGQAAADALSDKINELANDGWIIDKIIPATGLTPKQCAAFTIVAFK